MSRLVLLGSFGVSAMLCGLIWTIQLVQYPLFAAVGESSFSAYHAGHSLRISLVVVPMMVLELVLAVLLLWYRPSPGPTWAVVICSALVAVIWLSTFALQVPAHGILQGGFESATWSRLVATNWIRTLAWTGRTGLLGAMLWWSWRPE